jgi:hypothetical protein
MEEKATDSDCKGAKEEESEGNWCQFGAFKNASS